MNRAKEEKNGTSRAVIYARYSSHNQREESIEDQVRACEEAAAREGDEVIAVFFDRAASGTTDRRQGFRSMVELSKGGGWQRVWTYKTDRFARDRYDAAIYKRKLKKCGVSVKYAAEPIPDGPTGVLMESVLEGMAEYYSANLGENVARGLRGNALKCHPNGVSLYGWDIAGAHVDEKGKYHPGDHYEVNVREAEAAAIMYRMRASGYAWTAIASRLNELGYTSKQGGKISDKMVAAIVRSEAYRGVYSFADVRIEGGMPRIVTDEEWEAAQLPKARPAKHRKHVYVKPGMVFGSLRVIGQADSSAYRHTKWLCECSACGGAKVEWAQRLTSGKATHCGCLSADGRMRDALGRFAG